MGHPQEITKGDQQTTYGDPRNHERLSTEEYTHEHQPQDLDRRKSSEKATAGHGATQSCTEVVSIVLYFESDYLMLIGVCEVPMINTMPFKLQANLRQF